MQGTPFFEEHQNTFIQWLERLGYAVNTIKSHKRRLNRFFFYLKNNHITTLEAIDPKAMSSYDHYLDKLPIGSKSIAQHISTLRLFDQYLEKYGHEPIIKTRLRITPHLETKKTILTKAEIKTLYQATDNSALGYRDRAMLAVYYGCGLRAKEGLFLQMSDLDFKNGLLQVGKSKTYKPRYVPMSEKVKNDLREWLDYGRKLILKPACRQGRTESGAVLVHGKGEYKTATMFNERLKKLLDKAGIAKPVTLHGLRHSIATHLLENGMELEQIRQFLGHHSLEVTQRYTHIMYENGEL